MTEKRLTFFGHLEELRNRIRISLVVFILTFIIVFVFSAQILTYVWTAFLGAYAQSNTGVYLIADTVMSGIVTQINLSFIMAAAISMPVLIYEMFMFIEPALRTKHKLVAVKIILSASILFLTGVLFVYFVMLPLLLSFFIENNTALGITNFFSVESFFEFILINLFIGGLIFQTPLIIVALNRIGILPKAWLTGSRRFVYVFILVIAGILTPDPSIINQLILGGVMIVLFEISLIFSK
jgi:sec-independent protein translocase protein TatC